MILADIARQQSPAFIERTAENRIAADESFRAARGFLG